MLRRVLLTPRKSIIGKGGVRASENVVIHSHPIPQLHAALDGDAIADDDVIFDERVIADVAIPADPGAWKNVRIGPDPRPLADMRRFNNRGLMEVHTKVVKAT